MKTQIIQDNKGNPTGVYITMEDREIMNKNVSTIENEDNYIPKWQKDIVLKRMNAIKQNPNLLLEEDQFWNDLENEG